MGLSLRQRSTQGCWRHRVVVVVLLAVGLCSVLLVLPVDRPRELAVGSHDDGGWPRTVWDPPDWLHGERWRSLISVDVAVMTVLWIGPDQMMVSVICLARPL